MGEESLESIVSAVLADIIVESVRTPFRTEKEIHGYLQCRLRWATADTSATAESMVLPYTVLREVQTKRAYVRIDGRLRHAPDPIPGKTRRRGRIDVSILGQNDEPVVCFEIEYPRGRGKERKNLRDHFLNDLLKLQDMDCPGYMATFFYNYDPRTHLENFWNNIPSAGPEIRFLACLNDTKEKIFRFAVRPWDWIGEDGVLDSVRVLGYKGFRI